MVVKIALDDSLASTTWQICHMKIVIAIRTNDVIRMTDLLQKKYIDIC